MMPEVRGQYSIVRIRKKQNITQTNDFLMHYGISGQKWGVRRYQNEDRTLTEEGKKRYNRYDKAIRDIDSVLSSNDPKVKKAFSGKNRASLMAYRNKLVAKKEAREKRRSEKLAKKEAKKADIQESATWRPEEVKYLDDAELNRRNNRLQREKQYIDMTTPQWKKNVKRGAIGIITAATTVPLAGIATEAIRKIYRGEFNKFIAPILGKAAGVPAEIKVK